MHKIADIVQLQILLNLKYIFQVYEVFWSMYLSYICDMKAAHQSSWVEMKKNSLKSILRTTVQAIVLKITFVKAKRHQIIKDNNDGEEKDDELGNHNGLGCDQIDVKS